MELRHMRYFIAVAEELNFTKAAEKLYIAQPSLSKQIKDLEDELGIQLLVRDKRHVVLTKAGSEFLKYSYETLEVASRAISRTKQTLTENKSRLAISMNSAAEHFLIATILNYSENKKLSLDLQSNNCFKNLSELKNSRIDLCFSRFDLKDNEFNSKLVKEEEIYIAYKNKGKLQKSPYIEFPKIEDPVLNNAANSYIENNKIEIDKIFTTSNLFQFINIFENIDGWSIVPAHIIKLINCHYIETYLKSPIYINYRRNIRKDHINFIDNLLNFK